jgi:hypothetical protein
VLHLLDDNIVMMVEIFNRNASWAANHKVEDRLVNGIKDRMALINMATAMQYKMNQLF